MDGTKRAPIPIDDSPLATVREIVPAAHMLSDGPVRYLLVAGERDDGHVGIHRRVLEGRSTAAGAASS